MTAGALGSLEGTSDEGADGELGFAKNVLPIIVTHETCKVVRHGYGVLPYN